MTRAKRNVWYNTPDHNVLQIHTYCTAATATLWRRHEHGYRCSANTSLTLGFPRGHSVTVHGEELFTETPDIRALWVGLSDITTKQRFNIMYRKQLPNAVDVHHRAPSMLDVMLQ